MAFHEACHGLISQTLLDKEENLNVCAEKMQLTSPYNWNADWSFWGCFCRKVNFMCRLWSEVNKCQQKKFVDLKKNNSKTCMCVNKSLWNSVLGKKHFVNKRGLIELYETLKCGTSRFPLAYISYGCYCGPGGRGWPMDETDWCCHRHDCCYNFAQRQGCHPITERYKWTCQNNTVICDAVLDRCQNIICQCDKEAARCWRFAPFNKRYIFWPNHLCGQIYPPCGYKH